MLHWPPPVSPPAAWLRAQEGWDTIAGVAAPSPASPTLSSAVDTDAIENRESGLNISAPQCGLPRESTGLRVGLGTGRVGPPPHHLQLYLLTQGGAPQAKVRAGPGRDPPSKGPLSALLPKAATWNVGHPQTRPVKKKEDFGEGRTPAGSQRGLEVGRRKHSGS